jgi:hypothetical protein
VKIAGMVVWVLTAGIGVYLLAAGLAAQRQAADTARQSADSSPEPPPAGPGSASTASASTATGSGASASPVNASPAVAAQATEGATVVGVAALASGVLAASGTVASGAAPGSAAGGGESALLEFIHPALALTGLTFWIFFVVTSGRVFAWIAFGVVVAATAAGASWAFTGWRKASTAGRPAEARRPDSEGAVAHGFPGHLVLAHGVAAACTLALVVIAAVAAHP